MQKDLQANHYSVQKAAYNKGTSDEHTLTLGTCRYVHSLFLYLHPTVVCTAEDDGFLGVQGAVVLADGVIYLVTLDLKESSGFLLQLGLWNVGISRIVSYCIRLLYVRRSWEGSGCFLVRCAFGRVGYRGLAPGSLGALGRCAPKRP